MIIATYLVKNDSDILRESIIHHLNNGVDAFIVTENNPAPQTSAILNEFQEYILVRIKETGTNYAQSEWVTRMARFAAEFSPDLIFHSDADELWYGIKDIVMGDNIAVRTKCWYNYLPYKIDEFNIHDAMYYEHPIDVSWFGEGMQNKSKIIHKPDINIKIGQGNHTIVGVDDVPICDAYINHYPIRTYKQFEEKVITGGSAYERSQLPSYMGKQWRRWYENYKDGQLFNIYKSFMATPSNLRDALLDGRIICQNQNFL